MTLSEAERDYPRALEQIRTRIADWKAVTGADVILVSAECLAGKRSLELRVLTITDMIEEGTDDDCSYINFSAPLSEALN